MARFDALPPGIYYVFATDSANIQSAAQRRQRTLRIPGCTSVVASYVIHAEIASQTEKKVRETLTPFPFGKEMLVKAPLSAIDDVVSTVSSQEPKQVALRFHLLEEQVKSLESERDELLTSVKTLKDEVAQRTSEARQRKSEIRHLAGENRRLHGELADMKGELDSAYSKIRAYQTEDSNEYGDLDDEVEEDDEEC